MSSKTDFHVQFYIKTKPNKLLFSDSGSPSKRSKTSTPTLFWEWEGDRSAWTAFADDHNQEINDAFESGDNSVKMSVGGVEIEAKLDKMVLRNCKTGWERRMRSCIEDAGSCKS